MARDFFRRSTDGSQAVVGSVIEDIQSSLNAITAFGIKVDGIFGRQTEQSHSESTLI